MRVYTAIIEKCPETGLYVGYVPNFPGAHTQGETLDELYRNLHEVIEMSLEDGEPSPEAIFVGTQTLTPTGAAQPCHFTAGGTFLPFYCDK